MRTDINLENNTIKLTDKASIPWQPKMETEEFNEQFLKDKQDRDLAFETNKPDDGAVNLR